MLIENSRRVDLPIHVVERAIVERLEALEDLGEVVYREGEELRTRVGPETAIAKEVSLGFGQPRITTSGLAIPLMWEATGARALFPKLTGELEAFRVSTTTTMLRLRGSYEPPFGRVGDFIDRLLMARVARMTIDDWLERVALSLTGLPGVGSAAVGEPDLDHGTHAGK